MFRANDSFDSLQFANGMKNTAVGVTKTNKFLLVLIYRKTIPDWSLCAHCFAQSLCSSTFEIVEQFEKHYCKHHLNLKKRLWVFSTHFTWQKSKIKKKAKLGKINSLRNEVLFVKTRAMVLDFTAWYVFWQRLLAQIALN